MTDAEHNALIQRFRDAAIRLRTSRGSTDFFNLKDEFRRLGLTDAEMEALIAEVFFKPVW